MAAMGRLPPEGTPSPDWRLRGRKQTFSGLAARRRLGLTGRCAARDHQTNQGVDKNLKHVFFPRIYVEPFLSDDSSHFGAALRILLENVI